MSRWLAGDGDSNEGLLSEINNRGYQTSANVNDTLTTSNYVTSGNLTNATAHLVKNVSFSSTNRELIITKDDNSPQDPIPLNFIEPGSHLDNSISNLNKYATTAESDAACSLRLTELGASSASASRVLAGNRPGSESRRSRADALGGGHAESVAAPRAAGFAGNFLP